MEKNNKTKNNEKMCMNVPEEMQQVLSINSTTCCCKLVATFNRNQMMGAGRCVNPFLYNILLQSMFLIQLKALRTFVFNCDLLNVYKAEILKRKSEAFSSMFLPAIAFRMDQRTPR
jgi:hypothetical protein